MLNFSGNGKRLLFNFLRARWKAAAGAFLLDLTANLCVVSLSMLIAQVVAAHFGFHSVRGDLLGFRKISEAGLLSLLAIVVVAKMLLDYFRLWLRGTLSEHFAHSLRSRAFGQHLQMDIKFHENRESGRGLLRFSGDLASAQRLLVQGVLQFSADLTLLCLGFGLIAWMNGRLALFIGLLSLFAWVAVRLLNRRLRPLETNRRNQKSKLLVLVNATLGDLLGLRAFNRSKRAARRFRKKSEQVQTLGKRYQKLAALSAAFAAFFVQLLLLAALLFGSVSMMSGEVLFVVVLVLMSWRSPFSRLLRADLVWKKGLLSLEKMAILLQTPLAKEGNEVLPDKTARLLQVQALALKFGTHTVFQNLNFQLKVGETLCLEIPTASGKTSLAKMLMGLYQPDSGRVLWDGFDAQNLLAHHWRQQVSVVSDAFPIAGRDLCDALSPDSRTETKEIVREAFEQWQSLFPVLRNLHLQQKANLHSTALSAGQQHLLQCLRAVLAAKPFLILDEPFVGLERGLAKTLADLLQSLCANKGILLLSTHPEVLKSLGWENVRTEKLQQGE